MLTFALGVCVQRHHKLLPSGNLYRIGHKLERNYGQDIHLGGEMDRWDE